MNRFNLSGNKGALLFLAVVSLILILPPVIYQYPYPNLSDDTPRYLAGIERMVDGEPFYEDFGLDSRYMPFSSDDGSGKFYRYTAPAITGLVIKALHTDPYWSFYIFHYLSLIAIAISVWYFGTKAFNKLSGYIGVVFVVFCTPSFMQFFMDGAIFNLINILIFGLMGILSLIYFIKTSRLYYAVVSLMLFTICLIYHSSSGLEIYFGVLAFLGLYSIYQLIKRKAKALLIYLAVYIIIGVVVIITLCPESQTLVSSLSNIGQASGLNTSVSIYSFMLQKSSMIVLIIGICSAVYIFKHKDKLTVSMLVLLAIAVVITVTIFFKFGNPDRSAQDLSIILAMFLSGCVGTVLYSMRARFSRKDRLNGFLILAVITVPIMVHYFGYNSAVTPVDKQAIAFVNSLEGDTYNGSTQIEYSIYDLFLNKEYAEHSDYTIYRSKPMSGKTNPNHIYTHVIGNASVESDYAGLPILGQFEDGDLKIVIYSNE